MHARSMQDARIFVRYSIAVALVAFTLLLALVLQPWIGSSVLFLFLCAALASAWYVGQGPGIVASTLGTLGSAYVWLSLGEQMAVSARTGMLIRMCLFVLIALPLSILVAGFRKTADEVQDQREQLRFLADVSNVLTTSLDDKALLSQLVRLMVPRLADWCAVDLLDAERTHSRLVEIAGAPALAEEIRAVVARYPLDLNDQTHPLARVLHSGQAELHPTLSAPAPDLPAFAAERRRALLALHIQSCMFVPLIGHNGVIGAVSFLYAESGRHYTTDDLRLAEEIVGRAATAIDNAQLYADSLQAAARAASLHSVAAALTAALTPADVAAVMLRHGGAALNADGGAVMVLLPEVDELELLDAVGYPATFLEQQRRVPLAASSPLSDAVRTRELILFESREMAAVRYPRLAAVYPQIDIQAWANVPLLLPERAVGALELNFKTPRRFSADDRAFLLTLAQQCAQALDRARLYVALRANEAQLRLITDALPVLISYVDRNRYYRFNNKAYEDWFGRSRAGFTGRHMGDVLGPEAYAVFEPYIDMALTGETVAFEIEAPYRDVASRYIEATYVPDIGADGDVQGFIVLVGDITARKRSEAGMRLLVEASTAFAASLDYETTLDRLCQVAVPALADSAVIYLVEEKGYIARTAIAHVDPVREALLQDIERHYPFDPDSDLPVARVFRTGQAEMVSHVRLEDLQAMAHQPDQLRIYQALEPHSYIVVPMQVRGRMLGAMQFTLSVSRQSYDAADLALAEELARRAALGIDNARLYAAERHARTEAEAAVRVRDVFFSVAAHELRTPLTSLLGQAQLLQRRMQRQGENGEVQQRSAQIVVAQAVRLNKMVSALLDISRLEQGRLEIERAPLDLCELVQQVLEEIQPTLTQHSIVWEEWDGVLSIEGDALRLEQVLHNLVSNAVKYSPNGGPVRVSCTRTETTACVRVGDNGIGIPSEALSNLFSRFYRAPNAEAQQISGLGIGLYVVKEIVSLHGGSISVESSEGIGSTFTVCLPLADAPLVFGGQEPEYGSQESGVRTQETR